MSGSESSQPNRSRPMTIGIGIPTNSSSHWWDKISSSAPTMKTFSSSFSNHWNPPGGSSRLGDLCENPRRESFSSPSAEEHRRKSLDEWNTFTVGQAPF